MIERKEVSGIPHKPTKTDLMNALNCLFSAKSKKLIDLEARAEEVEAEFEEFKNTSHTYQRLDRQRDRQTSAVYRQSHQETNDLQGSIRRIKTKIHLKGVTPSIIREVEALVKRVVGS